LKDWTLEDPIYLLFREAYIQRRSIEDLPKGKEEEQEARRKEDLDSQSNRIQMGSSFSFASLG
jgi:hypothetical protein